MKVRIAVVAGMLLVLTVLMAGLAQAPEESSDCSKCSRCTTLLAKFEWNGSEYVFEKPAGNEGIVTISGDATGGTWASSQPVCCIVIKDGIGSTGEILYDVYYPGDTSGEDFSNAGIEEKDISHISFCSDGTVPVTLSSFTGTAEEGSVILDWTTGSETENLGYHVFRSLSEDGKYERVTQELIEGAGSSRDISHYRFVDQDVQPGMTYFYQLQDVSFAGETRIYGPVQVKLEKPAVQNRTWGKIKALLSTL